MAVVELTSDTDFKVADESLFQAIRDEKIKPTLVLGPVTYYLIDKKPYSFHFYARKESPKGQNVHIFELYYDLRFKEYYIRKNGRDLKFSYQNLDNIIPRVKEIFFHRKKAGTFHDNDEYIDRFFAMVSVEENKGMYNALLETVGAIGYERTDMTSRALIRLITDYSKLELLYKAGFGLSHLSTQTLNTIKEAGRNNAKKIHQVFGLKRFQLNFLQEELGSSAYKIEAIMSNIPAARCLKMSYIDIYRNVISYIPELEERYNLDDRMREFMNFNTVSNLCAAAQSKEAGGTRDRTFFDIIFTYDIKNYKRMLEYLLCECLVSQGLEYHNAIKTYRDYYRMCKEMEYERFDKYPKYLKTYHDVVARNYRVVLDEKQNEIFEEKVKEKEHYAEFTMRGDYAIVIPKTPAEIVTEGNVLGHCVASYVRQILEGKTFIMFLRDKNDLNKPLVTVEVRGGKITQARGFSNRSLEPAEREYLIKYATKHKLERRSW